MVNIVDQASPLGCSPTWLLWIGIVQRIHRPTIIRNHTSLVATIAYKIPIVIQRGSTRKITSHANNGNWITAGCLLPDLTLQQLQLCRTESSETFLDWFGHVFS